MYKGEKEYPFYGIYLADPATLDTHIFNYQLKPETFDYREMDADNYTVVIKGVHEGKKKRMKFQQNPRQKKRQRIQQKVH